MVTENYNTISNENRYLPNFHAAFFCKAWPGELSFGRQQGDSVYLSIKYHKSDEDKILA